MAAPALPVTTASYVPLGHDAATGEPVDYTAAIPGSRVCNGLITGGLGSGKSYLADRIAQHLEATREWTVTAIAADDPDAVGRALDALQQAEQLVSRRERHDPYHLVLWDGMHHFLRNPDLDAANFTERVATLLEHGPAYGVAQLATTTALSAVVYGSGHLRNLLADNVIALRAGRDTGAVLNGATIDPAALPSDHGHGLVLVGQQVVHVHLDAGQPPADCATCFADATASAAAAPDVAWDEATGHLACRDEAGRWRWLQYVDGPALGRRQMADLRQYPGLT